ncbi:MAG: tetratricopeptide repeat protein [Verrucomicrobiota bacterium]
MILELLPDCLGIFAQAGEPPSVAKEGDALGRSLLVFVGGGLLLGAAFLIWVLPALINKVNDMLYDSGEQVELDETQRARVLVAQGDYDTAISEFRKLSQKHPEDRVPVIEIAKIQLDKLADPDAAIATFEEVLDGREWGPEDAAFFLFRLEELYLEEKGDSAKAIELLEFVIEQFPETRFSANATHKLHEIRKTEPAASPTPLPVEPAVPAEEEEETFVSPPRPDA